ncbi:MAG TPA: hypothetical protein PLV92_12470 [Pirellulaceae bacterium]|nr:hypothetical protein [Pirellulaceae bacterium]
MSGVEVHGRQLQPQLRLARALEPVEGANVGLHLVHLAAHRTDVFFDAIDASAEIAHFELNGHDALAHAGVGLLSRLAGDGFPGAECGAADGDHRDDQVPSQLPAKEAEQFEVKASVRDGLGLRRGRGRWLWRHGVTVSEAVAVVTGRRT